MFKKIDLVFTSHPTMIYDINGIVRKERPTIQKEIEQVNFFTKKVINYLKKKNIKNIKISSWCGGDRDGHSLMSNNITKDVIKKINNEFDLDIRDNSKKINTLIKKYNKDNIDIIDFINKFNFSTDDELLSLINLMIDNQRFIISDCEEYFHIYFIYKASIYLNKKIKIVPLFESTECLTKSIDIINKCLQNNIFNENEIEIMLAYSDTSKTGGIIDSVFQLYNIQKKLHNLSKQYNKKIIFFHGRGGSFARGGGSYLDFFNRIPDENLSEFRVTVQGERIFHEFGDDKKIESTLNEIITSYKIRSENLHNYSDTFLNEIEKISNICRLNYKNFITNDIIEFFINDTYQSELTNLNCGSRPSKRKSSKITIDDIRTITWVFGWSSINFYLPCWLGYTKEFHDFNLQNKFIPWNNLCIGIIEYFNSSIITSKVSKKLINKYIEISTIINSNNLNLLDDIIKRKYVG